MGVKYTNTTDGEFKAVKELQKLGVAVSRICAITKRGSGTIHMMFNSDTFESYKALQRATKARSLANKAASNQTQVTAEIEQPEQPAAVNSDSLERIANALELIAERLKPVEQAEMVESSSIPMTKKYNFSAFKKEPF